MSSEALTLAPPPGGFFMTLWDIGLWVRSAQADSRFGRIRADSGAAAAFDQLYAGTSDPYGAGLPQYRYQRRKYESLLTMLPMRQYKKALDIGCGLGNFTRKLAPFVDEIIGTDISVEAIGQARGLSGAHANIGYSHEDVLATVARNGEFDLIVLADTLYYIEPLTDEKLQEIAAQVSRLLAPGGLLLLVNHYFFGIDPASRGTREIHDAFRWTPGLSRVAEHRRAFFLATVLEKSATIA